MKKFNILTIIPALLLVVFATTSCEEQFDIKDGGTLAAQLTAPTTINFFLGETDAVSFDVETLENEGVSISSISGTKVLYAGGEASDPATVSLGGGSFSQTKAELFADVPVGGTVLTEADLAPGDYWLVTYTMTLADGRVLPIQSSRATTIQFACRSNIPTDGTWTGVSQNFAFGVQGTNPNVTISAIDDGGNYAMSDVTGGFYGLFGFNVDQPGNINDLCNIITLVDAPDAQFALGPATTPGYWDPGTEELLVTWYDSGNDIDEATLHTRN